MRLVSPVYSAVLIGLAAIHDCRGRLGLLWMERDLSGATGTLTGSFDQEQRADSQE